MKSDSITGYPAFRRASSFLLLCCVGALGLSSCKLFKKNYEIMSDRVTPAIEDDVIVETPSGAPYMANDAPVPSAGASAAAVAAPARTYAGGGMEITIAPGDTLSGIASRYGVSTAALIQANNMTPQDADRIRAGQKLIVPGGSGAASAPRAVVAAPVVSRGGRKYTVRRGDTLSLIAARHGVSTAALIRANNMSPQDADRIREGQTLNIPAAGSR